MINTEKISLLFSEKHKTTKMHISIWAKESERASKRESETKNKNKSKKTKAKPEQQANITFYYL